MAIPKNETELINNETRENDLNIPENERVPFNADEINQEWNEIERAVLDLIERVAGGQHREINVIIRNNIGHI